MLSHTELAESGEFAEFFALAQDLTKVLVVLTDVKGQELYPLYSETQANPLCRLIRSCPAGFMACEEARRSRCREVAAHANGAITTCFVGLVNSGLRVMEGEEHVATLLCGQVSPVPPCETDFRALRDRCEELGLPTADLRAAYYRSPYLAPEKLDQALRLLSYFANLYCRMEEQLESAHSRQQHATIENAKGHIQRHFREPLRLGEVAAQVGLSPAYFSTLFKKSTGEAFCHYVQRLRMDEARRLLLETQDSVTAISRQVGFNSLTHFTRVFYRFEKCAPGRFRNKASGSAADQ